MKVDCTQPRANGLSSVPASPWLPYRKPQEAASLRLICFHYAGGSAGIFRNWQRRVGSDVEVCAVELPGHGMRFSEPLQNDIEPLLNLLDDALAPICNEPFAVFGHSMGALLGYAWIERRVRHFATMPDVFIPAGRLPPHLRSNKPRVRSLNNAALIERLRELGATPQDILEHPQFVESFLPIVRADLEINDSYSSVPKPLHCPIHVLGGTGDREAPVGDLQRWSELTKSDFYQTHFEDGHFFVQSQEMGVIQQVRRALLTKTFGINSFSTSRDTIHY